MADDRKGLLSLILGRGGKDVSRGFYFNSLDGKTASGNSVSTENAMENATVLSCVNLIAQGVAQLPWRVQLGNNPQDGHQVNQVLRRPNSFQTPYDFKNALVTDLLVFGNAFVRVNRSTNGRVTNIIPMDPADMSISANTMGLPLYRHDTYGEMTSQEVVHIRDIANHDVEGQSRVLLAAERVGALNAADRLIAETFANGVSMNYAVEMEAQLDEVSRKALYEQLKAAFGQGGSRRGGVAVLEGGKLSAIKGSTPADADLQNLRSMLIEEIAALFRVPASLVGGSGDQKYNNVSARMAGMYRDTYAPLITNIEQSFTRLLLPPGENEVKFDVSDLVKGDLQTQITLATTAAGGAAFMTQNEARTFIGLDPLSDPEYDKLPGEKAPEEVESDPDARRGEDNTDDGDMGDTPDEE